MQAFSPCYSISWSETTLVFYYFFSSQNHLSSADFSGIFSGHVLGTVTPEQFPRRGLSDLAFNVQERETAVEIFLVL